jgi:hypothetical protein
VAPRADRAPVWVHAGDVGVRVVGTAFTVTRTPGDHEVSVEVEHGTVEVHRAGTVAPVTRGQRWSSRDGTVIAMAPARAAPRPHGGSADDTSPDGAIGATRTHTPDLATGPAIDVSVLTDRDRPTITPGAGSGSGKVTPRTGSRPGTGSGSGTSASDVPAEAPGDIRVRIRTQPLAPALAAPGSTPEARVAELRKLAAELKGAEAATALYSLARTQYADAGRSSDALKTLDAYQTRVPRGAELEAVLWLRLRILCGSTFSDRCRAAAHTYAQRHPGTARGDIADVVKMAP